MALPFEVSEHRYQADSDYIYANDPKLRFDQKRLASLVGYVAIGLPIILGIGGALLESVGLGEFRKSLSGFYYVHVLLGDIFVGSLVFIGTLMFAYRGWSRKVADLATLAGLSAYLVALFPSDGWHLRPGDTPIFTQASNYIHAGAALALFLILAFFCFFVFTKVEPHQEDRSGTLVAAKKKRDTIYRLSGSLILLSIVAIGIGNLIGDRASALRVTYWAETVMLVAFGVSWLVQGRVSYTAMLDDRDKRDKAQVEAEEAAAEAG